MQLIFPQKYPPNSNFKGHSWYSLLEIAYNFVTGNYVSKPEVVRFPIKVI